MEISLIQPNFSIIVVVVPIVNNFMQNKHKCKKVAKLYYGMSNLKIFI